MSSPVHLLDQLVVVHSNNSSRTLATSDADGWLHVRTCQREVSIADTPAAAAASGSAQVLRGASAYRFLLETVAGLNSSVPGETNVQGQFRRQWQAWRSHARATARLRWTNALMQQLFADSKTIRAQYLQGIGGHSYGSLVRKLLEPAADDRLLFVGMGELAQSMLDLFSEFACGAWNRHALSESSYQQLRLFGPEQHQAAARWATLLIVTTPPDPSNDALWAGLRHSGIRRVVHLGRRRSEHGPWSAAADAQFLDLDDVFALQAAQSDLRMQKIVAARRACAQRAALLSAPPNPAAFAGLRALSLQA